MHNALLQPLDAQSLDGLKFRSLVYEMSKRVCETLAGIEAIRMRRGKCEQLVDEFGLPVVWLLMSAAQLRPCHAKAVG